MYADVQLLSTLTSPLSYRVPDSMVDQAMPGRRVLVPVVRTQQVGIIIKTSPVLSMEQKDIPRLRNITAFLDDGPIIPEDLLNLCMWSANYYVYPSGLVLRSILPENLRIKPRLFYILVNEDIASRELVSIFSRKSRGSKVSRETLMRAGIKQSAIRRWEKQGIISRSYELPAKSSSKRMRKMVKLCHPPSFINDKKFQEEVAALFYSHNGIVPYDVLRSSIRKNTRYWIRKWKQMGWIDEVEEEDPIIFESKFSQEISDEGPVEPTDYQRHVLNRIYETIDKEEFRPFLLYGVTGSGKTEIYLRLCEYAIKRGRGVLILVPEIALITQVEALFRHRFGSDVAVWHSGLDSSVRLDQWRAILRGMKKITLGVRSAVFAPVKNCGLIIVDEEHDPSYKQEDRFRYHARDVAVMRAEMLKIPVLLGSATPSIQSYYHAREGHYEMFILPERIRRDALQENAMPEVEIVDMRKESSNTVISTRLRDTMVENYEKGFQTLLFLNRRGFSACALCRRCGYMVECLSCSVAMTYHASKNELRCHYCGASKEVLHLCPKCEKGVLVFLGIGTERVEAEVKKVLPQARIIRIDRDAIGGMEELIERLNAIRKGAVDVIVGTQMLAKGHDFPGINITGLIYADMGFGLPDYRAGEITAQQIFQVSGRPGRRNTKGHVIIQTYNPDHYIFKALTSHAYHSFCDTELKSRQFLSYPPFVRMARLICSSSVAEEAYRAVYEMRSILSSELVRDAQALGPAPAPFFKLRGLYRWHIILKTRTSREMNKILQKVSCSEIIERWKRKKVFFAIDRDPMMCL